MARHATRNQSVSPIISYIFLLFTVCPQDCTLTYLLPVLQADPTSNLRGPYYPGWEPDGPLRGRIVDYLRHSLGKSRELVKRALPVKMARWSNVRIENGDRIRCEIAQRNKFALRDSAFVRVSLWLLKLYI